MRKLLFSILMVFACDQGKSKLDDNTPTVKAAKGSGKGSAVADNAINIDSKDILARPVQNTEVDVKHVLIGWGDLDATAYRGHIDPRAKSRSNADAAKLAQQIADKLRANPDSLDAVIKESSEDPGSLSGDPYTITKTTGFVEEFKNMALRLHPKEVGIVKSMFGYHVMMIAPPGPLDPLESKDILDRPANAGPVSVQHILIGWKDAPMAAKASDPRSKDRTKDAADKIATDLLAKAKAPGADFAKLMKDFSEDPGSKDTGKAYDVTAESQFVATFKRMALRLNEGEVGLVKSGFGWHIMKRLPPDPLESADILKRDVQAPKVKVKHILLGWADAHAQDPRGVKRTRAELEKLVKDTEAKLNGGAKIEDLMKELSEDPGSAKSGDGYDVTPDSQFVPTFKNLALRLKLNEVGAVKSPYGIHVMKRVE